MRVRIRDLEDFEACVLAAEQWAEEIEDDDLQRYMNRLIREYEGSPEHDGG